MKFSKVIILLAFLSLSASAQVSGWHDGAIGTPALTGSASGTTTITLQDAGARIWDRFGASGHLLFSYTRDEGASKYVTARVTSIGSTDQYAQGCVGFWAGRNNDGRFAALCTTKSKGTQLIVRRGLGSTFSVVADVPTIAAQPYLRIKRVFDATTGGYDITAQHSTDGTTWVTVGTTFINQLGPIVWNGIASSSHDTSLHSTTFTNVVSDYAVITNVFFISPTATSGTGTEDDPWTLYKGWNTQFASIPADSVVFRRGGVYRAKMIVKTSGTSGHPIEHRAYPGESPDINGTVRKVLQTAITAATGPNSCGFTLDNGDYLEPNVKLSVDGPGIRGEDIRITNCTVGCTVIGDATPTGCVRGDNGTTPATYAAGQAVGIWGPVLTVTGSYNDFYDLHIYQELTNRTHVDGRYAGVSQNEDQQWPSFIGPGFLNAGVNNNVYGGHIHDNADGLSGFTSVGGDIDSTLIYANGGAGRNRCNGMAMYLQSGSSTIRYVKRVMSLNPYSAAVKIAGVAGPVLNFTLQDSIMVNGGSQCLRGSWAQQGFGAFTLDYVSDGIPMQNIIANNNVVVGNPKSSTTVVEFGYVTANNDNMTFTNNYILNGNRLAQFQNIRRGTIQNNFFYATNTVQSPAVVTSKWSTYGPFSGTATLTGTTLTRTSGDSFQATSWANSLCVEGCQSQLSLSGGTCGAGNYNIVTDSVNAIGTQLTLTQGVGGTCTGLTWSVAQVQSHPITGSYTYNNNTYYNNTGSNDFGSTPASFNDQNYIFIWARNNRPAAVSNANNSSSGTCFGGGTLKAPPDNSGATNCSWTGWSGNDTTGSTFNTGKPSNSLNFIKFTKLIDGLAAGWKAFVWNQTWDDTGDVVLTSANMNTLMRSGDFFEVRKGENPDVVVYSGQYAGSNVSFTVTDRSVKAASGAGYSIPSTLPRGVALIIIAK